ncbi:lipopolysaccharide biosynthesis protein [Nocardioides pacificus]
MLAHSFTSVIDQAWLSLLNMGVGLALVRGTSQTDYGTYAQLFAAGLLAVTVAEAVVVNPLTTLGSTRREHERGSLVGDLVALHRRTTGLIVLVLGLAAYLVLGPGEGKAAAVAGAFTVYTYLTVRRELQRAIGFLEGRPGSVLVTDIAYGVVMLGAVGALAWWGRLDLAMVLLAMAGAALVPLVVGARLPGREGDRGEYAHHRREALVRARLALPGALISWVVNFSYLYVAAALVSTAAAAELNASRLLLVPISLSVVAWARVARPMLGRVLADDDRGVLRRLVVTSSVALVVVAFAYSAVVVAGLPWLEEHVLGGDYDDLGALVIAWAVYFLAYSLRSIGTVLLLSLDAYKVLLVSAVVSLGLLAVALPVLLLLFGTAGAVSALVVVEVMTGVLVWGRFVPHALRGYRPTRTGASR